MIEVTDAAAEMIKKSQSPGMVIRMFPAAIYGREADYVLALGAPEKDDLIYNSNGVGIHMSPQDAELLRETIVDYVNDERGTGFIVRGPLDEPEGCAGCSNIDTCDHDHSPCDHDHSSCGHDGCGHSHGDNDCGCS
jgi:iron-sulfur cluster assembly protein